MLDILASPAERLSASDLRLMFTASAFIAPSTIVLLDEVHSRSLLLRQSPIGFLLVSLLHSRPKQWTTKLDAVCGMC